MSREVNLNNESTPFLPGVFFATQAFPRWQQFHSVFQYWHEFDCDRKTEEKIDLAQKAYYALVLPAVIRARMTPNLGLFWVSILNFWDVVSCISAISTVPRLYREYDSDKKNTLKKAIFWSTSLFFPFVLLPLTVVSIALSIEYAIQFDFQKNIWSATAPLGNPLLSFFQAVAYGIAMAICAITQAHVFYENHHNSKPVDSVLIQNIRRYIARDSLFGVVRDVACSIGSLLNAWASLLLTPAFLTADLPFYLLTSMMNLGQLFFMLYQKKGINIHADDMPDETMLNQIPSNYHFLARKVSMQQSAEAGDSLPTAASPSINASVV